MGRGVSIRRLQKKQDGSAARASTLECRMFDWLGRRRRRRSPRGPFPQTWREVLERNVAQYAWLTTDEREALEQLVQVFVAEKHWEAFQGLVMTDEIRVTVAGQACLLVLGLEHELYRNVETIYVYPSTVLPVRVEEPYLTRPRIVRDGVLPALGEAHLRGPIVLSWDAVRRDSRHPERGHNLVIHEFAHKLDMLDGYADGVPPLGDKSEYQRWQEVCEHEYENLVRQTERGERTLLDPYGSLHRAEFFSVVTETFFDRPIALQAEHPALYEVFRGFYRQDTAERERRARTAGSPPDPGS